LRPPLRKRVSGVSTCRASSRLRCSTHTDRDNNLPAPGARADILANVVVLHSSENSIALGGPRLGAEHLVELNYKSYLTPWLLMQPVVQWFVQLDGNPTRQTVVVAGFRTKITF
jgi:hypothetical protein